jgi:hypothetical protein
MMAELVDLTRRRFGRLLVIWKLPPKYSPNGTPRTRYLCRCDCGTVKVVDAQPLRTRDTLSCGCLRREIAAEKARLHGRFTRWTREISAVYAGVLAREREWMEWMSGTEPNATRLSPC